MHFHFRMDLIWLNCLYQKIMMFMASSDVPVALTQVEFSICMLIQKLISMGK